jgi:glycosyltransferase involved in cell wall biosynthesis
MFPAWKRGLASVILSRAVAGAARVVVTSRCTEGELLARHPGVAPRLERIPLGVGPAPSGEVSAESAERARKLQPFVLCVGNRKPHKNLPAAVRALAKLRTDGFPILRLVIAGAGPSHEFRQAAADESVVEAVVDVGAVSDDLLHALYGAAEALFFPSLFEGFGLPVLEAMAAGTPVVASNRASVPEVVGSAGEVADPDDVDAFAAAARRVIGDPAHRAELVRRGRERAAELSWERCVSATADLLCDVAAHRART